MSIRKILMLCGVSGVMMLSASCGIAKDGETVSSADIQDSFSCNAVIHYGDMESDSILKRYGKGMWENEFVSPDTIAGVKLVFNNDDVTASYKGLEFSVPKSAMPFQSMLCCLIEAADSVYESSEIIFNENDGLLCYEGNIEQGDYEICFDSATGFIHSFSMPNMELKIEFTECTADSGTPETSALSSDTVQDTSESEISETSADTDEQ
jgi:hypothetical protein